MSSDAQWKFRTMRISWFPMFEWSSTKNCVRERRTSDQKKYFNSSELGFFSTAANSNLGSVDTGAVGAVREKQKQDFDQTQDSGPSYS